nr:retinol dehydrogenase 8-like [Lytechinus pictus]
MASRIALITGCSSGIGMETALRLAQRSKDPITVYATMRKMTSRDDIDLRAGDSLDKTLFVRRLDVTKEDTIVDVVSHIKSLHGRLDILVNNAGIAGPCILEATDLNIFRKMFETNFFGAVRLTQEVLPIMKKQRSGRIVNISSIAGFAGFPFYELYGSSKFALEGFTESLAMICRRFTIRVTSVQPGPVLTKVEHNPDISDDLLAQLENEEVDEETMNVFRDRIELRKRTLQDIAQPVDEVVDIIEGIIDDEKPLLRYQTSESSREMARIRAQDPTGDAWIESCLNPNTYHLHNDRDK